jgi:hypothetical protein
LNTHERRSGDAYLKVLDEVARVSPEAALGPALKAVPNDKWATEVGEGTASLAALKPRGRVRLRTDFGNLRVATEVRSYAKSSPTAASRPRTPSTWLPTALGTPCSAMISFRGDLHDRFHCTSTATSEP